MKASSLDVRRRAVTAIDRGTSCRPGRPAVSASDAIVWNAQEAETGEATPYAEGGEGRAAQIDTHASVIASALDNSWDLSLTELQTKLHQRGVTVDIATLWCFFEQQRIRRTLESINRT